MLSKAQKNAQTFPMISERTLSDCLRGYLAPSHWNRVTYVCISSAIYLGVAFQGYSQSKFSDYIITTETNCFQSADGPWAYPCYPQELQRNTARACELPWSISYLCVYFNLFDTIVWTRGFENKLDELTAQQQRRVCWDHRKDRRADPEFQPSSILS